MPRQQGKKNTCIRVFEIDEIVDTFMGDQERKVIRNEQLNNKFGGILVLGGPEFEKQTDYNEINGENEHSVTQSKVDSGKGNVKVVQDPLETSKVREFKFDQGSSGLEKRFATDVLRGWSVAMVVKRPSVEQQVRLFDLHLQ